MTSSSLIKALNKIHFLGILEHFVKHIRAHNTHHDMINPPLLNICGLVLIVLVFNS